MKLNNGYTYPIRDILLIQGHTAIGNWQHPNIENLINEYCTPSDINDGYYDGPLVRAIYENVTIVALLENNVYDTFINECLSNKMKTPLAHTSLHEYFAVMLLEDVWVPQDEQFCFTEYGKKLGKVFSYEIPYKFISPDLGLRLDDDIDPNSNWGYCT